MASKTSLSGEGEEASTSKMSVLTDHPTPFEAKRLENNVCACTFWHIHMTHTLYVDTTEIDKRAHLPKILF